LCKQGIDQQMFNKKSISRKITHPQSLFKYNIFVILREIDSLLKFADRFLAYTHRGKCILE